MAKNNQEKTGTNNTEVKNVENTEKVKGKVIALPIDPLNAKDNEVKVIINGRETVIKRGVQQTVSPEVYERLVIAGLVIEGKK